MPNAADLKKAMSKTRGGGTKPSRYSTTTTTPHTSTGKHVVDARVGPGGYGMGSGSMEWLSPGAPLRVNPGAAVTGAINATGSARGQTMGSASDIGRAAYGPSPGPSISISSSGGGGRRGGGGGGGGGGGYAGPMIDQGTFDSILATIRGTKPKRLTYHHLSLPDYVAPDYYEFDRSLYDMPDYAAPEFYEFDRSVYDRVLGGQGGDVGDLARTVAEDRRLGMGAYAEARTALGDYVDPYAGAGPVMDPGTRAAMERMFAANEGTDPALLDELDFLAGQSNATMRGVTDLLSAASRERNAGNMRALAADERRFNEQLDADERRTRMAYEMALANALADYGKERFAYDVDTSRYKHGMDVTEAMRLADAMSAYTRDRFAYDADAARYGHDIDMREAMANYMRSNEVMDANTTNESDWMAATLQPIIDLILGGMSEGKQSLYLIGL